MKRANPECEHDLKRAGARRPGGYGADRCRKQAQWLRELITQPELPLKFDDPERLHLQDELLELGQRMSYQCMNLPSFTIPPGLDAWADYAMSTDLPTLRRVVSAIRILKDSKPMWEQCMLMLKPMSITHPKDVEAIRKRELVS